MTSSNQKHVPLFIAADNFNEEIVHPDDINVPNFFKNEGKRIRFWRFILWSAIKKKHPNALYAFQDASGNFVIVVSRKYGGPKAINKLPIENWSASLPTRLRQALALKHIPGKIKNAIKFPQFVIPS